MPTRLSPGVYVEEVPAGTRAIEAAPTSTPIFVGEAERGPMEATRITSRTDYERYYGGYFRETASLTHLPERVSLADAMDAYFKNGGKDAYILRAIPASAIPAAISFPGWAPTLPTLQASSPGVWGNDVKVAFGEPADPDEVGSRFRIRVQAWSFDSNAFEDVEDWDNLSLDPDDENYLVDVLRRSTYLALGDEDIEGAALPVPLDAHDTAAPTYTAMTGGGGGDGVPLPSTGYEALLARLDEVTDASLLVMPGKTEAETYYGEGLAYVTNRPRQDLFYIADVSRQASAADTGTAMQNMMIEYGGMASSDYAAVYWPWIQVTDPVGVGKDPTIYLPPSSFVAGLYARTDSRRGVWKAPAGVDATLLGIRKLEYKVLDAHQDKMNPKGVNALRILPVGGSVIWGARTTRPNSEWRYVPVRRTAMFLRKSIYDGIQWAVFEPNDEPLWASLRLTIGAFMEQQFRQGAFAGKTSQEAYFVKCDSETTTPDDQAAGIVYIWVGFAPLRPAEFVVVRLSQKVDQQS